MSYKVGDIESPSGMATMKAIVVSHYGSPAHSTMSMVSDFPRPVSAAPSEVIIKVQAASINAIDINKCTGKLRDLLGDVFPYVVGYDFSGIVDVVGSEVLRFRPGDEVYGCLSPTLEDDLDKRRRPYGTFAEYCICDESELAHKPLGVLHEHAAAIPLAALTAIEAFEKARFKAKNCKSAFISGGGTGVGSIALQIAKEVYGATRIVTTVVPIQEAVVSMQNDQRVVKVISNQKSLEELKGCRDFDMIMDNSGDAIWLMDLRLLTDKGICISTVAPPSADEAASVFEISMLKRFLLNLKSSKYQKTAQRAGVEFHRIFPLSSGEVLETVINPHLERGSIKPIIDSCHTFEHYGKAFKIFKCGNPNGKVVVRIAKPGSRQVQVLHDESLGAMFRSTALVSEAAEPTTAEELKSEHNQIASATSHKSSSSSSPNETESERSDKEFSTSEIGPGMAIEQEQTRGKKYCINGVPFPEGMPESTRGYIQRALLSGGHSGMIELHSNSRPAARGQISDSEIDY